MNAFGLTFEPLAANLFSDPLSESVLYSDGASEEENLLNTVDSVDDLSSLSWRLQDAGSSWPGRYHFSVHRGAIIRCLPFASSKSVLELGAGCGAITRALGERFHRVDAVEGSVRRAKVCARRCKDLSSVQVFAADIGKLSPPPVYDLVFLIGVLEWSEGFLAGPHPFHRCLEIAAAALKDDGVLVLAIENQLGLKYFLGAGEDHCGTPLEGLHGYPNVGKAKTFSRATLASLLKENKFLECQFLYPFPDYKFAKSVLTDDAVAIGSEPIAHWASRHPVEDYRDPAKYGYGNQILITAEIAKAGLLGQLSNSFLMLAGKTDSAMLTPPWLVWSEHLARNMSVNSVTTLERQTAGLKVRKEYLNLSASAPANSEFQLCPQTENRFFDGYSLEMELLRSAMAGRSESFQNIVAEWLVYVRKHFTATEADFIRAEAWDCIPRNVIRLASNELVAFDLEFRRLTPFTIEELCGRGLFNWFCDHARWSTNLYPDAKTIRSKMIHVLAAVFRGIEPAHLIGSVVASERSFQLWVNPGLSVDFDVALDAKIISADAKGDVIHALRAKEIELAQLQKHADRLQLFSDTVRRTIPYRVYRKFVRPFLTVWHGNRDDGSRIK